MNALAGQVAVVTGASSGIGAAIARALAAQGAQLCLVGRHSDTLQSLADSLAGNTRPRCYRADLCEDGDVAALAAGLLHNHAGVDVLVHAAGTFEAGTLAPPQPAQLDTQYRTNVRAPLLLTQALQGSLRARQGQIVFVNSSAGLVARAQNGGYAATKHALKALADSLREELNPDGVRVLSVYPGRTATPMQARVHAAEGRAYRPELLMQPQDVASVVVHALTLPRTAEVTDIMMRPLLKPR